MENKLSPRIELNRVVSHINLSFGVSPERMNEIYQKFIATAKIYPHYATLAEAFLNSAQFNEKEKFFGMFMLGKMFGMLVIVKRKGIRLAYSSTNPEGQLLKLLQNTIKITDLGKMV